MHVEIRELQGDGGERTVATFRWDGHLVTCDNAALWNHLIQATGGVVVGERGRKYTPRDGEEFLRNLRFQYRGPYLFAREVDGAAGATQQPAGTAVDPEPAVVVEIPEEPAAIRVALCRALFRLNLTWGALEPAAATVALGSVLRLLEARWGRTVAEVFTDPELRIKLNNARYGVTPPPVIPRLVARADREWQRLKISLVRDQAREGLVHAQLMGEFLRLVTSHGGSWSDELGQPPPLEGQCVGVRPGEPDAAWDELGWDADGDDTELGFLDLASRRAARAIDRARECGPAGELHKAMVALRQAVTYDPWAAEGRTLLGEVLLRMEHPLAETELRRALTVETVRMGAAPAPARLGSALRRLRLHQALARCALVQGRVGAGRGHLETALALLETIRDHGGTSVGPQPDEEHLRELTDRILAVLVNIAHEGGDRSDVLAYQEVAHCAGDTEAVRGRAEDPPGVSRPLSGGEEPGDID